MERFDLKIIPSTSTVAVIAGSDFGEAAISIDSDFFIKMMESPGSLRDFYKRSMHGAPSQGSEPEEFGEDLLVVFLGAKYWTYLIELSADHSRELSTYA